MRTSPVLAPLCLAAALLAVAPAARAENPHPSPGAPRGGAAAALTVGVLAAAASIPALVVGGLAVAGAPRTDTSPGREPNALVGGVTIGWAAALQITGVAGAVWGGLVLRGGATDAAPRAWLAPYAGPTGAGLAVVGRF